MVMSKCNCNFEAKGELCQCSQALTPEPKAIKTKNAYVYLTKFFNTLEN